MSSASRLNNCSHEASKHHGSLGPISGRSAESARWASAPPDAFSQCLESNLHQLSEAERQSILSVVKRDLEVRCVEKHRLRKAKQQILQQDTKAPLRIDGDSTSCSICYSQFIILVNPRSKCSICRRDICRRCCKPYQATEGALCKICSLDVFYKAMVCQWFYNNSPNRVSPHASDAILRSLFKERLPDLQCVTEEQLHDVVSLYLAPKKGTYVNGAFVTLDVINKIKNEQLVVFNKRYTEIKVEKATSNFLTQTREALRQLLHMLFITSEKCNVALDLQTGQHNGLNALQIVQQQIEKIVKHTIDLPQAFVSIAMEDDLESYVPSVTEGPEEFLANILLEDLTNSLKSQRANGLPRIPQRPK